jgi:hypothetical protein
MAEDTGRDIREEVKISLFWRALIGDYEYVKFNPDDMLRWYDALELRGPLEIREVINERYSSRPVSRVQGIVSGAPHPPTWLVRDWLMHHENKITTGRYWIAAAAFVLLFFMVGPLMYGLTTLKPLSTYVMHPPNSGPEPYQPAMPSGSNFTPTPQQPPATFTPGQTSPHSSGIAGAAMGLSPVGGVTGSTNGGLSAGVSTATSSSGGTQP